jgi:hypothetical protein
MFSKRNKMVSIRLSDEEFSRLLEVCAAKGARSLSDLARDAMHRLMDGQGTEQDEELLKVQLEQLAFKVGHLQEEVERLATLVGATER